MFDAQVDGPVSTVSSLSALPPSSAEVSPQSPPCDLDPTSALRGMSPVAVPDESNNLHQFSGAGAMAGESGNWDRSGSPSMATPRSSDDGLPPANPKVTFEDFAIRFRQNQQKQAQRKSLERRLHATKVSVGISSRLTRIGAAAQRGLVECLKHDDKINFVSLCHTLCEIQESCDSALRRQFHREDPFDDLMPSPDSEPGSPDFFHQLSPQSRADLLEIVQLVRSDPQFLFERLCSLTPAQVASLTTSASVLDADPVFPAFRPHGQPSLSKRNPSASIPHKDYAFAFERTDPLSALLFNVFAAPLDSDAPEARLRLDVWSSVCAKLITHGDSRHYPLVGHILSSWAMCSSWKAKPKFELYLMDILQSGAFLLEHTDTPSGLGPGHGGLDPLRTDVAEEFFASSVSALFNLLDDPEAGFPNAVMELGCAILGKLGAPGKRDRFLEFFFVKWFFTKFLSGALAYPETHGLLLDFHIRKDAREKLLGQVGLRAHSQFFAVLRSIPQFSTVSPAVRRNIENIIARFKDTACAELISTCGASDSAYGNGRSPSSVFLMLSPSDILTILKALIPRNPSVCSLPTSSSGPSLSVSPVLSHPERSAFAAEPGFLRHKLGNYSSHSLNSNTAFPAEMNFLSLAENSLSRNADRIRFELSDLGETGHPSLEHPSLEDWAIFSIARDGKSLIWGLFSDDPFNLSDNASVGAQSTTLGIEDNNEALQTAIVKLVKENPTNDGLNCRLPSQQTTGVSLKQRFGRAMSHCHHDSDFIGAHYWWNASQQLVRSVDGSPSRLADDSWILEPMHSSSTQSLSRSRSVIERCESDFVMLDRAMQQLQRTVKEVMATIAKLRNKMWYMTDVKNSMRYEDAKNVALALKTMIYSALYQQTPTESPPRGGARLLAESLLQKPELQVMNIMKAPSSQGGPNKLSGDQVELTRKWLSHNNIDNFCRGEERIHRFCYEVKTSVNRLVGETMTDAPVLWSSELFQKERSKYEGHGRFLGLSGSSSRPFSAAGEDSVSYRSSLRASDAISRFSQDPPSLAHRSSFQSLMSDKLGSPREYSAADTMTLGDSPGRAASTSTRDSCSTFWSTPHQQAYYAASASSLYSRPPSMFSDSAPQPPRRDDRKTHAKQTFLDELRQTLTSLLLSDLGSPVWSCGSETDAWFSNALDQKRIREQMEKRARIQKFYEEYDERPSRVTTRCARESGRSRSLEPRNTWKRVTEEGPSAAASERVQQSDRDRGSSFSYGTVFRRLIEAFSRHGNPFVKLKALRDLRALVIASLNSHDARPVLGGFVDPVNAGARDTGLGGRRQRASFSGTRPTHTLEKDVFRTPSSPVAESIVFDSQLSEYYRPTDNQIVDALKRLLLEIKPKTLFRDLQFISAFVSSETLNKTDSGKAFLQFGLAALGLKDEVCNSMVEIADTIVSQELSRRHPPAGYDMNLRRGNAIEDAAGMWIITAKEGNPVAQRELAILYLTHPELLRRVTLPLTSPRDTFKAEMMYRRDKDSKSDPQSMCLALHWMQLSASGGDELARNRLREREEFDSIA